MSVDSRKEYFTIDDFPDWAKEEAAKLLLTHGPGIEERYGISLESVVLSAKLSEGAGRIDFNTSIGVIPFRVVRPQEAP